MTMASSVIDKYGLIYFYSRQISKLRKIGIGHKTENRVTVTQNLIDITNKRLTQLRKMKGTQINGIRHQHYANTNCTTNC